MDEHKIYTENRYKNGGSTGLCRFGKCLCGAVLENQQEIDEHKEEFGA